MRDSRYIKEIAIEIKNKTPLKIGSGDSEFDLLIDKSTNLPMIPGSSIGGAFRNYLNSICEESENIDNLFGSENFGKSENSKIYISDSYGNTLSTNTRTGISKDYEYQTAKDKALYTLTLLNEGINFVLNFKVFAKNLSELNLGDKYIKLCTEAIQNKNLRLGGNKTSGFGVFEVLSIKERDFDLSKNEDLKSYILQSKEYTNFEINKLNNFDSNKNNIKFKFKGNIKDSIIIKDSTTIHKYDFVNMQNGNKEYIIPGSTIKGLFRSYSSKILKTINKDLDIIEIIYGSNRNRKENHTMGRFFAEDVIIKNENECVYNRTKVDRFTGGVMTGIDESGKFDEQRINGDIEFEINIKKTDNDDINNSCIALTLLCLRDLALSKVTLGSSSGVGSGRLEGKSIIIDDKGKKVEIKFDKGKINISDLDYINSIINSLQNL